MEVEEYEKNDRIDMVADRNENKSRKEFQKKQDENKENKMVTVAKEIEHIPIENLR